MPICPYDSSAFFWTARHCQVTWWWQWNAKCGQWRHCDMARHGAGTSLGTVNDGQRCSPWWGRGKMTPGRSPMSMPLPSTNHPKCVFCCQDVLKWSKIWWYPIYHPFIDWFFSINHPDPSRASPILGNPKIWRRRLRVKTFPKADVVGYFSARGSFPWPVPQGMVW